MANSQRGTSKINYLLRYQDIRRNIEEKVSIQSNKNTVFLITLSTIINVILSLAFILHKVKHKYNKRLVNKYTKKIF